MKTALTITIDSDLRNELAALAVARQIPLSHLAESWLFAGQRSDDAPVTAEKS